MKKKVVLVIAAVVVVAAGLLFAGTGGESAWEVLSAGNARFAAGGPSKIDASAARRTEVARGQHPMATVLCCSDSRVPPELIFDRGLGEVFIVRLAGNVVDDVGLGSIEYGVEHLHTPLLVVLGHSRCGAVTAAFEPHAKEEGSIGAILKKIHPAVAKAKASGKKDKIELLDIAVRENVKNTREDLLKRSRIIEELNRSGKLKIVMAVYDIGSGKVASFGE